MTSAAVAPADPPPIPTTPTLLPTPAEAIAGSHGASINLIATTDDGTSAVTADQTGSIRLWPTLDGTREPVVVTAAHPAQLAIARDHAELVIADLDPAGALELVRTTAHGAPVSRTGVTSARPYARVRILSRGILAVRDDQIVEVLDLHGALVGALPVPPGARVADILVRRDRALAIVVAGTRTRGRWIELADAPAWGAESATLRLDPTLPMALAPDHRRVAGVLVAHVPNTSRAPAIADLGTGHLTEPPGYADSEEPPSPLFDGAPVGFTDNASLAILQNGVVLTWKSNDVVAEDHTNDGFGTGDAAISIADHIVVSGRGAALGIERDGVVSFLGYRLVHPRLLRRAGGRLFVGEPSTSVEWSELGDDLGERRVVAPAPAYGPYLAALPIDAHHGVALVGGAQDLADLVWFKDGSETVDVVERGVGKYLDYDDESHLLVVSTITGAEFFHVDPRTGELGKGIPMPMEGEVHLVDPSRAHGRIGILVDRGGRDDPYGTASIRSLRDLCATCEIHVKIGRAQHVVLDNGDEQRLARGDLTQLADLTPFARTSPDHAHVATFAQDRVTLRDADGTERWTVAAPGVTDVVWTEGGELLVLANGLARLDVDTGAFVARHCGWRFALSPEQPFDQGPVVCDAP